MIPLKNIEQMRALVGDVFREALSENNDVLKKDISSTVTADVMHEMDFLLQAKERQQEEHFRKLDEALTRRRKKLKPVKAEKEAAATKVTRLPVVSQTRKRRRLFQRRRKTTIY